MSKRTISVTFEIDEDTLKKSVDMENYNFDDAVNQELEWLHEGGFSAVTWKEKEGE